MNNYIKNQRLIFSAVLAFFLLGLIIYPKIGQAVSRSSLEQKAIKLQAEINKYKKDISRKSKNIETLGQQKEIIQDEIAQSELEIQASQTGLEVVNLAIEDKINQVDNLKVEMNQEKSILAEQVRIIYYFDQEPIIGKILSDQDFSEILNTISAIENIQAQIKTSLDSLKKVKKVLNQEKQELEEQESEKKGLLKLQEAQKRGLERKAWSKNRLLNKVQNEQVSLELSLSQSSAELNQVRSKIKLLQSGGKSLSFEQALKYAQYGAKLSNVRPSFLLAILSKESGWNANVGTCFYTEALRGKSAKKRKKAFEQITKELGKDPAVTLVSCPMKMNGRYVGSGGAMGACQFMPDTWQGYQSEVGRLTGHNPPNPWEVGDCIVGMGLKLASAGANEKTYDSEWKAAMIYFAGGNWNNKKFRFYGDKVMALADLYQMEIDAE
ncbi:hypothetical protein CL633_02860 [bacterium]|nr:hypothetical protein [bacterium]